MSRNALVRVVFVFWLLGPAGAFCASGPSAPAAHLSLQKAGTVHARVVIVQNPDATFQFQPNSAAVQDMVNRGVTHITGKATIAGAWQSLLSTNDVVGIKVYSAPGPINGTRPAVVAAVIHGLLDAGVPPHHIIIWDKNADDLRNAGYFKLAAKLGVQAAGCLQAGYDPTNFYLPDTPIIGRLVWGDLEFGKKGPNVGKKSFFTKLLTRHITKIISIAPLLNQDAAGVCGHLYGLAMGSVDNTMRFEGNPGRLSIAVPEIYALPAIGDRVVLNITDALIGQYEGSSKGLLQYSTVLNQLWFSHDPVALDRLAIQELGRERQSSEASAFNPNLQLYSNAALLQLGVDDLTGIQIEKLP